MTYRLLEVGVEVEETGEVILPSSERWHDYKVDLANGAQTLPHRLPEPPSLDFIRAELKALVNRQRDACIAGGVTFNGILYDSDVSSRESLSDTMMNIAAGMTLPPDFAWRAADNTDHVMVDADIVSMGQAFGTQKYMCHLVARALKAAIDAAEDPRGIDIYEGWPA